MDKLTIIKIVAITIILVHVFLVAAVLELKLLSISGVVIYLIVPTVITINIYKYEGISLIEAIEHYEKHLEESSRDRVISPSPLTNVMSNEEKKAYVKTPKWKDKVKALHLRLGKCEKCDTTNSLEAHHNTYARLGDELPSDLNLLCRACHQDIHLELGFSRSRDYPIGVKGLTAYEVQLLDELAK